MKINRLNHTKSLYPHFYDKTDDSNFTKHLKVVGEPQLDIRHKLKTIEWSRILEKPLQIWKEQTQSYVYDMHFKVIVPFLKQVNIYKNPVISVDEEVVGYEELCLTESFPYEDRVRLYEKILSDLTSVHRIPKDTYLLEIYTWDDYHFLKGYPENDYTIKEDNVLEWRYNESFLSINIEEISYSKYLTFRVHKDKIKQVKIYKNDSLLLNELFDMDIIANSKSTDLSYYYSDDDFTNENTYLQSGFHSYFEVEDTEHNHIKIYVADSDVEEYVFRLALNNDDFEDGILKDTYDLEVVTFEKRYRCRQEYDKVYSKRYCGYDEQLNDCFDHDYSLDMIGRLLNIHRFRFYQVYRADDYYLSRTYPTYYDKATEDDYHYMKRIQFYISNYNHIAFPILEFWKYYHTMATIRSRKRIVDEMDYAYLRTNIDDCYIDFDGVEEEFESETVTEYSINKATLTSGESNKITVDDNVWHESTIVKDVYVVPNVDYRLRFGVWKNIEFDEEYLLENANTTEYELVCELSDSLKQITDKLFIVEENNKYNGYVVEVTETVEDGETIEHRNFVSVVSDVPYTIIPVTGRLICYNRQGVELRTTPIIENTIDDTDKQYTSTDCYVYKDLIVSIPSDTVSVKIVLESNTSFSFADATFERMTVVNFDNYYMGTDEDYNSNVYELYCVYEELPTNLRIGGDRFNILFKRSLPLTKRGFFLVDINEEKTNYVEATTNLELYVKNILMGNETSGVIGVNNDYEVTVDYFIKENNTYNLSYFVKSDDVDTTYQSDDEDETEYFVPVINDEELVFTTITYYDSESNEISSEEMRQKIYSNIKSHINHEFLTPTDTSKIIITISSDTSAELSDIQLSRIEELTDDEVYINGN